MIPFSIAFSFVIAAVFTVVVPIVTLIILGIKRRISGLPLLFGAAAFFLSQIILRMPLMNILSGQSWYQDLTAQFFLNVLFLSFSAGLFEESARLGGALLLKKHRSYKDVISFGVGHAFCEVILLVGIANISNAILCLSINSGNGLSMLPSERMETMLAWLTGTNIMDVYMGILERFIAVIFHIFATVLVFTGVTKKKIHYYLLAILAHTLFNLSAVLLARFTGTVITEIMLLIVALTMGFYVLKRKDDFNIKQQATYYPTKSVY